MEASQKETYSFFIGIDMSKKVFDAGIIDLNGVKKGHRKFTNNETGFADFLTWVEEMVGVESLLFIMEHTGIYSRMLWFYLQDHQLSLWMESGFQIKQGMGIAKGKNDKIDSYRIAEYALNRRYKVKQTPQYEPDLVLLHDLLSARNRLITSRNMLEKPIAEMKQYAHIDTYKSILATNQAALDGIKQSLKDLEKQINEVIDKHPEWQKNLELACSVKGIGKWIGLWILVYSRNFDKGFNSRRFASLAGVAPFESISGSSVRKGTHTSHFSHKFLKGILHTAVMAVCKHDPKMKAYKKRKKEEGKKGYVVLNNMKNKIIHQVFAVVKKQTPYDPSYLHKNAA